jgi:hypothetical protein
MKVTSQEWDRAQSIFNKLSPQERQSFVGIRTRELPWLLAPEEAVRPQYRKIIFDSRKALEQIFSNHQLTESACKELLARMLVLGETQIFRKCRNVQDPVEVVDTLEDQPSKFTPSSLQAKLESMAVDLLDDSSLDQNVPDDLMPFQARYGITESEFFGIYLHSIRKDRLQRYEPFRSMGTSLNSREQKKWQFYESSGAAGVKADKKDGNEARICEDSILLLEGSGFQVGAVFDGLGYANNSMNVLWQEVLKKSITKQFRLLLFPFSEEALKKCMERSIRSAQKKMKQIFSHLTASVSMYRRDIPRISSDKVNRFDRICAKLKEQGLDVDEDLRWYVLDHSAATTMELVVLTPGGAGYLCRVGDGQSVIVDSKTEQVRPIGTRRKNKNQTTAFLGIYHHTRSLEVIPFSIKKGDLVLTMTDGPGDTYESQDALKGLGQVFLKQSSLRAGLNRFCVKVDGNQRRKSDDYALVAMQIENIQKGR